WPPVPAGRHTTYKSLSAGYPARNTSASPHGCFGGRQRTENGSPGRLCREIFRGFPQDRSLFFQPLHIRPQRPLIGPQRIVLDPQASKLLLGCLGPIRRARGHLASFLPRLEHPRLDRATGDAKIGRDLGIRHIGMSLVQRDGVGFELIGVLLLWHGFYSHSPAHYGPDSACPPLRVHPRKDFESAGHLASYAGLAPVTWRSGTSIRGDHSSRRGNKILKRALFLSAFAALKD